MKKRILAMLLTLAMMLGMLPTVALATEADLGPLSISGGEGWYWDIDEIPTYEDQIDELDYDLEYIYNGSTYYIRMENAMTISGDSTRGTATGYSLVINEDLTANLTFEDLNLETSYSTITLRDGATLNLTLKGNSTLTAGNYGFDIGDGATLNITDESTGSLTVYSETAGIYAYSSDLALNLSGGNMSLYSTGYGIYSNGSDNSIAISDGSLNIYSGTESAMEFYNFTALDIDITGGDVTLWAGCTFDDDWTPTMVTTYSSGYSSIYAIYGRPANGATQYDFRIGDADVEAIGFSGAIVLGGAGSDSSSCEPVDILVDGNAELLAYTNYLSNGNPNYGLGGSTTGFTSGRTITIEDNAKVTLAKESGTDYDGSPTYTNRSFLGGGDNSNSTITLQGNAILYAAAGMGSHGLDNNGTTGEQNGYDGGTINILGNASIGYKEDSTPASEFNSNGDVGIANDGSNYSSSGYTGRIGGAFGYNVGGDGGNITIDTTGQIWVQEIGGGHGETAGGDGGNITIKNGEIHTSHVGGGSVSGYYATTGGSGGNITISGGSVNANGFASTMVGAAAAIGGGGAKSYDTAASVTGGNGGNITITGGTIYAEVKQYANDDFGGAAIGGGGAGSDSAVGTGGSGGTINISGGTIVLSCDSDIDEYVSTFIGGGSLGGAGEITISGGTFSGLTPSHYNDEGYGADSSNIGAAKGATDAGGWVHIVGGSIDLTGGIADTRPGTWPTTDDEDILYPVMLNDWWGIEFPDGVSSNDFYGDITLMSLTLTDTEGNVYPYGTTDMSIDNSAFSIWVPGPSDAEAAAIPDYDYEKYYNIAFNIRLNDSNTTYSFAGELSLGNNGGNSYDYYLNDIGASLNLELLGESISSIALTSDHTGGSFTYSGEDQAPTFTVRNQDSQVLTEGTDYEIEILWGGMVNGYEVDKKVSGIVDHGEYLVTATGLGEYEGMTSTLDFFVNPLYLDIELETPQTFTKEYDGTTDVLDGEGNVIESLALAVTEESLSNVTMTPSYVDASIGTNIGISGRVTADGNENGNFDFTTYTEEDGYVITGDIALMVVGESDIDSSDIIVTKIYDTTTSVSLSNVSGDLKLVDAEGNELCTITYTAVTDFSDANVATENKTVTLTLGSLEGANSANYTLAGGATSVTVPATITTADYSYTLTSAQQAQEFTQGGDIADISVAQTASGVNNETVIGTVKLYTDSACTTELTDTVAKTWTTGAQSIYVAFTPDASQTNYTDKVTTGEVIVLTIVEGDPQTITWNWSTGTGTSAPPFNTTYGTDATGYTANSSTDGGAIFYSSSDTDVVTVDSSSGAVTIVGAGSATITATAAAVDGLYRETTTSYAITVGKMDVDVTINNQTKKFGEANPDLTASVGTLASDDEEADLKIQLETTATETAVVGEYSITGTYDNANYNVTVTAGTLSVTKADSPELATISKSVYYGTGDTVTITIDDIPADAGDCKVTLAETTDGSGIITAINDTTITVAAGALDTTATITATVEMDNYENAEAIITITLVNKTLVTISGITVADKVYDGKSGTYSGTAAGDNGYTGSFVYSWDSSSADVGTYILTVSIPESDENYMGTASYTVNITPAPLTIKPANQSVYNGYDLPTTFTLEYNGLVTDDTITMDGEAVYTLTDSEGAELADSSTNGTYNIVLSGVTFSNSNYTITTADGTLTISTKSSGSSNTGTPVDTGSDSSSDTTDTSSDTSSDTTVDSSTVTPTTTTSGNTTTATVTESDMTAAVDAAVESGETAVEIQAEASANATKVEVAIPATSLSSLADSDAETLTVTSDLGSITLTSEAAASVADQAGDEDIQIVVGLVDKEEELNTKQQEAVGDSDVYDLSIMSNGKYITNFDGGLITIELPYELKDGENPACVTIWYLDDDGNIETMNAMYNVATQSVIFTSTHLSFYVVGYVPFTDVLAEDYFYAPAMWALDEGITTGATETTFAPYASANRGEVVTFLWRAMGEPEATMDNPFTDLDTTAYYYEAVLWAVEMGITSGTTATTFEPKADCSRGQTVTFLYRLAGEPAVTGDCDFTDMEADGYYYNAVLWAVEQEITSGIDATSFAPNEECARGQIVTFLYRFFN